MLTLSADLMTQLLDQSGSRFKHLQCKKMKFFSLLLDFHGLAPAWAPA
jgi:hypothetical protein